MNARRLVTLLLVLALVIPVGVPAEVRATGPTAPDAPTGAAAIMGDGEATVTWTAPADDGGSPITGYAVTAVEDPTKTATVGNVFLARVTGLANGTSYSFTVVATNAVGSSPASAASNAVMPTAATVVNTAVTWTGLRTFGNLTILSGGSVTHAAGDATLQIEVTGTLRVESGGSIDVTGKGCATGTRWSGTGCTTSGASTGSAGGSYGGSGTVRSSDRGYIGSTYGDPTNPAELGAGGGSGAGGGLVRLRAGSLVLDGALRANGQTASSGGSGGGIRIDAATFSGAGTIEARGGNSTDAFGGAGGGGRIAVYAATSSFGGTLLAAGGADSGCCPWAAGGTGTIYTWLAPVASNLRVANLADTAFDLSWTSDRDTTAEVRYGITDTLGVRQTVATVPDVRGAAFSGRTHYVTVGGIDPTTGAADPYWNLTPSTTYWYEVLSDGPEFVIATGSATTGPSLTPTGSDVHYGYVARADGTRVANALVYLTVQDADATDSAGSAGLLSAVSGSDGSWSLDLSRARTPDLSAAFTYGPDDRLRYSADATPLRPGSRVLTAGVASPITITVPGADLALASSSLDPVQPMAGLTTTWSVVVSNPGGGDWLGAASDSAIAVRLAVDGQPQVPITSTASLDRGLSLNLGSTVVFTPGVHTLRFELVPSGSQAVEDDPLNNVLTRTITATVADLTLLSATIAPAQPSVGAPVTATVVVGNLGSADWLGAVGNSFFDVFMTIDGQVGASVQSDVPVGHGVSVTLNLPFTLTTGIHTVQVELVPGGAQAVGDDPANNALTRTVSTTQADLAVASATYTPTLPVAGRVMTWSVVVANEGNGDWLGGAAGGFFDLAVSVDGAPLTMLHNTDPVSQGLGLTLTVPLTPTTGVQTVRFVVVPAGDQAVGDDPANNALSQSPLIYEAFAYRFGPGWNVVTLALSPVVTVRVGDLAAAANGDGADRLLEAYRFQNGMWEGALVTGTTVINDFEVALEEAYFFRFAGRTTWELLGSPLAEPVSLALQVGWNLVGVPYASAPLNAAGVVAATDIVSGTETIHRVLEVDRWVHGGYEGHVAGYPFNNFAIQRDWGYFLRTSEPFTWTPE